MAIGRNLPKPALNGKILSYLVHLGLNFNTLHLFIYVFNIILVTSRKPREDEKDGQAYKFVSRSEMEADIKAGKYLEHGEYEGNLYGTKIDSILEVVQTGRTCILDVNPQVSCMDSKAVLKF